MPRETMGYTKGGASLLPAAIAGYGMDIALVSIAGWPGASLSLAPSEVVSSFMVAKNLAFCLFFLAAFLLTSTGSPRVHALLRRPAAYWAPSLSFVVGSAIVEAVLPVVVAASP